MATDLKSYLKGNNNGIFKNWNRIPLFKSINWYSRRHCRF